MGENVGAGANTKVATGQNIWGFLIVAVGVGAVVGLSVWVLGKFTGTFDQATDLIALISVAIAPIATIAAAAFGVTVGTQTAAAAGEKVANEKQKTVDSVTGEAGALARRVLALRQTIPSTATAGFMGDNRTTVADEISAIAGALDVLSRR